MREPDHDPDTAPADTLWDFASAIHAKTETACLTLQDDYGADVSLLLFGAWFGAAHALALTDEQAGRADQWVRAWRIKVIQPLRAVRRSLKTSPISGPYGEDLRAKVKTAELDGERIQLDWLEQQTATWRGVGGPDPVDHNLRALFALSAGQDLDATAAKHLAAIAAAVEAL